MKIPARDAVLAVSDVAINVRARKVIITEEPIKKVKFINAKLIGGMAQKHL